MVSQSTDNQNIPSGQQKPNDTWGLFNNMTFLVQQALAKMQTATLVRIESCTNAGDLSPVGFVDVTPLVNQIDLQGNPTPHTIVHNLPYFRLQGGANGIIIDPQVGDIGVAVFASRDISKIKSTKAQGNPGSYRQYSYSDGMYLGGMLNGIPTQYVQFSSSGIHIHSPTQVKIYAPDALIEASTVEINADTSTTITTPIFIVNGDTIVNGSVTASGDVIGGGISLDTHVHISAPPGSPTSAPV